MERLFLGVTSGIFLAVLTINTGSILTTDNSNYDNCFLKSRRECQNILTSPSPSASPSTKEGSVNILPSSISHSFAESGSTSRRLIEVAND